MRVVPLDAFRDKVSFVTAIGAMERGFRALALGEAVLPDPMVVELPAERAGQLARELSQVVETRVAPALESAVRDSRVIVTATASTSPLVMASWVAPGTHVTSVGTGSPEKIELEPALLARADKVVADRVTQTERYGNLHRAVHRRRRPLHVRDDPASRAGGVDGRLGAHARSESRHARVVRAHRGRPA